MTLAEVAKQVKACSRCELRAEATQPVPGIGQTHVKYMLIGEAPGQNEDELGIPFVGLSGKRLDKLVALAGINLNDCYLTNVCKCRPPKNRQPRKKEVACCVPYLK